jgi:hypothetical protein
LVLCVLTAFLPAAAQTGDGTACPRAGPATEVRLDSAATGAVRARPDTAARRDSMRIGAAPDIIVRASVSAREVRFASQPRVSIRLCGGTLDSIRILERRNLPSPVVAGTTYRDVRVAIEILGHLNASCITRGLTGGRAGAPGTASDPCAALGIRDSARATRAPQRRPPL